jgi:hypothetical protein
MEESGVCLFEILIQSFEKSISNLNILNIDFKFLNLRILDDALCIMSIRVPTITSSARVQDGERPKRAAEAVHGSSRVTHGLRPKRYRMTLAELGAKLLPPRRARAEQFRRKLCLRHEHAQAEGSRL